MKIAGYDLVSIRSQFQLQRAGSTPLVVTMQPLPIGFTQRLKAHGIIPPQPPKLILRDHHGKPLRDNQGNVQTSFDQTHPDYLLSLDNYHQQVAVLAVYIALQIDEHVEFETEIDDSITDWKPLADLLLQELASANWTYGDLMLLCREICRISNLLPEHLHESAQVFSSSRDRGT